MTEALVLAALVPFVTFAAHQGVEELRKYRAYRRLKNDPLFFAGARFRYLESEGRDRPLLARGRIEDFGRGYVRVSGYGNGNRVNATWTCREFERLTPLWEETHG